MNNLQQSSKKISKRHLIAFLYAVFCLVALLNFHPSYADKASSKELIRIEPPVVVKGVDGEIRNLDQHHLSFSARAIYSILDDAVSSDIYITTYSLWPKKKAVTKRYHVANSGNVVFAPQFSPDGAKVLFKVGWPYDSHSMYKMYLWDIKTNDVHEVRMPFSSFDVTADTFQNKKAAPLQYSFPIVQWSPNGQYLSYIRGGDVYGHIIYDGHVFLDAFDLQHVIRRFLVRNDGVPYGYSWTSDNNILYSTIESSTIDIYRISPEARNRKLILKNAYRPTPSPDGSKIAFFGPEHFETPIKLKEGYLDIRRPHGLSLTVANADGTNRKALNREELYYPEVIWMPDSKHLLTMDPGTSYTSDNDKPTGKMSTNSKVTLWDIETGRRKHICDIPAQDVQFIDRSPITQQFTPLQLSENGKILFVGVSEITQGQADRNSQYMSIKAIDIPPGEIYDIGKLNNVYDLQWRLEKPDLSLLKK